MKTLYHDWIEAFENIGLKPMSDDTCCRLLAILQVYGDGNEIFTHHIKFLEDVKYAQRRCNLFGGEVPNLELIDDLKYYIVQLENGNNEWVDKFLLDKYNIKINL